MRFGQYTNSLNQFLSGAYAHESEVKLNKVGDAPLVAEEAVAETGVTPGDLPNVSPKDEVIADEAQECQACNGACSKTADGKAYECKECGGTCGKKMAAECADCGTDCEKGPAE